MNALSVRLRFWAIFQTSELKVSVSYLVIHTAPESVERVKSSAQILGKSFFWRLSATNALGGSLESSEDSIVERLSKMESSDDRSYLQLHLWFSTSRKMIYSLCLCATFYTSGAVYIVISELFHRTASLVHAF